MQVGLLAQWPARSDTPYYACTVIHNDPYNRLSNIVEGFCILLKSNIMNCV